MAESKSQPKQKVNWTLDVDAIEIVREKAQELSKTGVKVSESAAANLIIKQSGKDTDNGKKDR